MELVPISGGLRLADRLSRLHLRSIQRPTAGSPVFRLRRAFHESLDFPKLPAYLHDDLARGQAHRQHAERAEEEWQDAAEEQAHDHQWIRQVKSEWRPFAAPDFLRI